MSFPLKDVTFLPARLRQSTRHKAHRTLMDLGRERDHRMNRSYLKGANVDSLQAVLFAAGYNIRWLLRTIVKKAELFLRLLQAAGLTNFTDLQRELRGIFTVNPSNSSSRHRVVG